MRLYLVTYVLVNPCGYVRIIDVPISIASSSFRCFVSLRQSVSVSFSNRRRYL